MLKWLLVLVTIVTTSAFAARVLPEGAYTQLDSFSPPTIRLDGKEYQTSAAFQIRDTQNRLISAARVPKDAPIWVQAEPTRKDLIWRAWLLSPDEVAQLKAAGRIKEAGFSLFGLECLLVSCD